MVFFSSFLAALSFFPFFTGFAFFPMILLRSIANCAPRGSRAHMEQPAHQTTPGPAVAPAGFKGKHLALPSPSPQTNLRPAFAGKSCAALNYSTDLVGWSDRREVLTFPILSAAKSEYASAGWPSKLTICCIGL